jgi:hypothetical protein
VQQSPLTWRCRCCRAADDYIEYLRDSGIKLCALGADGDVLRAAGLPVHVSPQEVRGTLQATALCVCTAHNRYACDMAGFMLAPYCCCCCCCCHLRGELCARQPSWHMTLPVCWQAELGNCRRRCLTCQQA